jgi:hypothetical protein
VWVVLITRRKRLDNGQPTAPAPATIPRINEAARIWQNAIFNPSDITNPVQASMNSDKVRKFRKHSKVDRRITLPSGERFAYCMRPDFQGSGMIDIGIPVERQPKNDVYYAFSVRTPSDSDNTDVFSTNRTKSSTAQLNGDLKGNINRVGDNGVDLNDFLNFDTTANELRNVALEEVAYREW